MRAVLRKGFMYRVPLRPETLLYVSENKTLAGREDKGHLGEAAGRKLVVSLFATDAHGSAHRVDKEICAMRPHLLNIAEILQVLGFALPPDPDRSAAETELLFEEHYQRLHATRHTCTLDTEAGEMHVYTLSEQADAEEALVLKSAPAART